MQTTARRACATSRKRWAKRRAYLARRTIVKAEAIAREILVTAPNLQEARIILARALLGQNKIDEAEKLFRLALEETLPTPATLAWANIGLGEISLRKGQAAEAAKRFNDAVRADAEYASSLAARAGRIKAETAANTLPVDAAIRTFHRATGSGDRQWQESRAGLAHCFRRVGAVHQWRGRHAT